MHPRIVLAAKPRRRAHLPFRSLALSDRAFALAAPSLDALARPFAICPKALSAALLTATRRRSHARIRPTFIAERTDSLVLRGRWCYYALRRLSAKALEEMMEESVRWTVRVSKDTDVAVRTFLAQRGMKKGDLAKFIEEAVRWRVFDATVAETKARNAGVPEAEIEAAIDEALATVRAERFGSRRR